MTYDIPQALASDRGHKQDERQINDSVRATTARKLPFRTPLDHQPTYKELHTYPDWAQDIVKETDDAKQDVLRLDLWELMRTAKINQTTVWNFMVAIWPFIERFPKYMAQNLLKTQYGRSVGDDMARSWLLQNMRVEQKHAEFWVDWANGSGVSTTDLFEGTAPRGTDGLTIWCEEVCSDYQPDGLGLAAGMMATNFAIEGVTGEWAASLYNSETYRDSIPASGRIKSLRWLQMHAKYDDNHPWEALAAVANLLGKNPRPFEVDYLKEVVRRSYTSMCIVGDHCLDGGPRPMAQAVAA